MDKDIGYYQELKEIYQDLINFLINNDLGLTCNFKEVIDMCENIVRIYDDATIDDYDENFDDLLIICLNYLFTRLRSLQLILEQIFHLDYLKFGEYASTINLLLYLYDIRDDIFRYENANDILDSLDRLEVKITQKLENETHASKEDFGELDALTINYYKERGTEWVSIYEIIEEVNDDYFRENEN